MCLLYHIVRLRVNRICVDFLLIVLTWGLGSDPSTGAAQMERLYGPQKTETAAQDWITSEYIQYYLSESPSALIHLNNTFVSIII